LIGFMILWAMRPFESRMERFQLASLTVRVAAGQLSAQQLRTQLEAARFKVKSFSLTHAVSERRDEFQCEVRWPATQGDSDPPAVLTSLEQLPGIIELKWESAKSAPQ
jgi:hypothetical protein